MSRETTTLSEPRRLELHDLLEEPGFDPAVVFAAYAFGQARVAARHIKISVIPVLVGRDQKYAQLLLEAIRRGSNLQESVLHVTFPGDQGRASLEFSGRG